MQRIRLLASCLLVAALTACGSRDSAPAPEVTPTPSIQSAPANAAPSAPAAAAGAACGGVAGLQCVAGHFCEMQPGRCTVADDQGACAEVPQFCTQDYRPVCGCDARTYSNACAARAASVSIDFEGECPAAASGGNTH